MTVDDESAPVTTSGSILVVSLMLVFVSMVGSFAVAAATQITFCGENNRYADVSAVSNACRNFPEALFWLWIAGPPVLAVVAGAVAVDRDRWRPLAVGFGLAALVSLGPAIVIRMIAPDAA